MSLKSFILNLLFPVNCLSCQEEGAWLCEKCFRKLKVNSKTYNFPAPNLTEIFIAGDYEDKLLAELIRKFKFSFIKDTGLVLSRFLIFFWRQIEFSRLEFQEKNRKNLLVIPVPLSKKRERFRGFNQSEILAENFSAFYSYSLGLDLKRKKNNPPQSSLSEIDRGLNIKNSFVWRGESLNGKTIILIDDIITTGATLDECAKELKNAGADAVYAFVVAKG